MEVATLTRTNVIALMLCAVVVEVAAIATGAVIVAVVLPVACGYALGRWLDA